MYYTTFHRSRAIMSSMSTKHETHSRTHRHYPVVSERTRMSARVPLQVERVVEALAAERAQIALHVRVALGVAREEALQGERLQCGHIQSSDAQPTNTVFDMPTVHILRDCRRDYSIAINHIELTTVAPS